MRGSRSPEFTNDEEFPFYQSQISMSLGRVVGFFDENHEHFYILLLDHKHNLQPSKDYSYKVGDTTQMFCEYTSLLMEVARIKGIQCIAEGGNCKNELGSVPA